MVTFTPERGDAITVRSDRADGAVRIPLDTAPGDVAGWAAYVAGVMWALRQAGHPLPGGAMSDHQRRRDGVGAVVVGGAGVRGAGRDRGGRRCVASTAREQARLAQRAENDYVGAPTGLLDQLASLFGRPATALLIDFRDLTVAPVAFDPDAAGVALLLIDSRARHTSRRRRLRRAPRVVRAGGRRSRGVVAARGRTTAGPSAARRGADPVDARRARHVLTENQRVLDCRCCAR